MQTSKLNRKNLRKLNHCKSPLGIKFTPKSCLPAQLRQATDRNSLILFLVAVPRFTLLSIIIESTCTRHSYYSALFRYVLLYHKVDR